MNNASQTTNPGPARELTPAEMQQAGGGGVLIALLLPAVQSAREAAR